MSDPMPWEAGVGGIAGSILLPLSKMGHREVLVFVLMVAEVLAFRVLYFFNGYIRFIKDVLFFVVDIATRGFRTLCVASLVCCCWPLVFCCAVPYGISSFCMWLFWYTDDDLRDEPLIVVPRDEDRGDPQMEYLQDGQLPLAEDRDAVQPVVQDQPRRRRLLPLPPELHSPESEQVQEVAQLDRGQEPGFQDLELQRLLQQLQQEMEEAGRVRPSSNE